MHLRPLIRGMLPGTPLALLLLTTYEIGFPGWPDRTSTRLAGFWGVNYEKGACTSPLFHFPSSTPLIYIPVFALSPALSVLHAYLFIIGIA